MKIRDKTNIPDNQDTDTKFVFSKLTVPSEPTSNKDTISKSYVDNSFNDLSANNLLTGVLPLECIQYTGVVEKNELTQQFELNHFTTDVGEIKVPTVDSTGRISKGGNLEVSGVPDLPWSKIVKNKPSNLDGYGITDGVKMSGDFIPFEVICDENPTSELHAVNLEYTQSVIGSGNGLNSGAILSSSIDITPSGFLRANGAEVSKVTYADLYAVIGDTFTGSNQVPGGGKPWRQQYEINTEQSSDITGWSAGTSLFEGLFGSQAIVTKNRVYLLGGVKTAGAASTIYTATINEDGTLDAWSIDGNLPDPLRNSQAVVTKNRVYVLGGHSGTGAISTVYTAPINADGTLGAWTTGTPLPEPSRMAQVIVTKDRIYLLGGWNVSTVYTSLINEDGTLGEWTTGASLPGHLAYSQAIVTKNRAYLLGGFNGSIWLSTVYTAPINTDGTLGTWSEDSSLPGPLGNSQSVVTKNRVYLLGGFNSGAVSTVYTASINEDGTLGTWTTGTSLPTNLHLPQAIVVKNRVYLLGGNGGSGAVSTVYTAPILGGLNDYSPYYDGTITPTDPNNFKLPDYSIRETNTEKYYIKY